jgi:hypothetical protein
VLAALAGARLSDPASLDALREIADDPDSAMASRRRGARRSMSNPYGAPCARARQTLAPVRYVLFGPLTQSTSAAGSASPTS